MYIECETALSSDRLIIKKFFWKLPSCKILFVEKLFELTFRVTKIDSIKNLYKFNWRYEIKSSLIWIHWNKSKLITTAYIDQYETIIPYIKITIFHNWSKLMQIRGDSLNKTYKNQPISNQIESNRIINSSKSS